MFLRVFKRGHQRYLDKLSEYLDDRLDAEERARIEGHLEGCAQCRQEFESLRETIGLLRRVSLVEPPRSFKLQEAPSPAPRPSLLGRFILGAPGAGRPALAWSMQLSTAAVAIALGVLLAGDFGGLFGDGDTVQGPASQAASQEAQFTTESLPEPAQAPEAPSPAAAESAPVAPAAPAPQQAMPAPPPGELPTAEEGEAVSDDVTEDASRQAEALEGQEPVPQATPGEEKLAEAGEPEKEGDGSVVRKVQIGVGAFLGVLAAATAYITLRRRRALS